MFINNEHAKLLPNRVIPTDRLGSSLDKSGNTIERPFQLINAEAVVVLRAQQSQHPRFVFTYKGEPIRYELSNTAWGKALKRAGIEDFRWHDLRHTWASWHVMNGTPLNALMELGGWSSHQLQLRYAHPSSGQLAQYADRLSRPRLVGEAGAQELPTHHSLKMVSDT